MRYNYTMRTRWLPVITGFFVAVLLISNIASIKPVLLGPFTFDGGTILFPFSYIFGDILTEVYGYRASRKVIWTGFVCAALMAVVMWFIGNLPAPSSDWEPEAQAGFERVLLPVWRIVIASLIAYTAGEFTNSYILAKLKIYTKGKYLWVRTISSTLIGQAFDTIIFCLIAFLHYFTPQTLILVILSNYFFKCGFEILVTPLTYLVVIGLKKSEGMDAYDIGTDFNPFKILGSDLPTPQGNNNLINSH